MRSGFMGFSSGFGLESGLGFFVALGGAIGRFADRGESTSISEGKKSSEQKIAVVFVD